MFLRKYCPWLFALPGLLRRHKLTTAGVLLLGVVVGWYACTPRVAKAQRQAAVTVTAMQPTVSTRDPLEKQIDLLREQNEAQQKTQEAMAKTLKELLAKAESDKKALDDERAQTAQRLAEQQQRFDNTLAAARTASSRERTQARSEPAREVTPLVTTSTTPQSVTPAGPLFELRTLRPEPRSGPQRPLPPLANQDETAYLSAGCLAQVRVVTGAMATSQVGGETWGHPVLFAVDNAFHCPWRLGGPGRRPQPSGIELAGCFAIGKAKADMSSSRVIIAVELLSCVWPDGSGYEVPIKGYAVDQDGTLGIVGELHTHDSAKIALAFLVGIVHEASAAFGLAKSQVVVTQSGGVQPFQGAQTTLQQVSTLFLEQARALLPTLWVKSDTKAYLVMQEGLPLQGYPVVALLGKDRS